MSDIVEMKKTKTLANCKPTEFLKQTNKIRKSVEKWLKVTEIMNIRKGAPVLKKITDEMTEEERKATFNENQEISRAFAFDKLSTMLDAIMEEHPDETIELLALMCFIEPQDADNHPISEYLSAFTEIISDKTVLDFLSSLIRLANSDISDIANQ